MTRSTLIPFVAVLLAFTAGGTAPRSQALAVDVSQALTDRIASDGSALVIVGVQANLALEGDLAGPDAIQFQRDSLHAVLDDAMARAEAIGVDSPRRFETVPFFTARVDAAALAALRGLPGVTGIYQDVAEPPHLIESVPLVGAPAAWAAGSTGSSWAVAILDTGVATSHPFFAGRVVGEACFSDAGGVGGDSTSLCPNGASIQVGPGAGVNCEYPAITGCYHGTHVAGIAAGANGTGALAGASGVAPGAHILAVQVFSRFSDASDCSPSAAPCVLAYTSDQIRGLEYVLATAGPGNANRVASANMSLGGGGFATAAACDASNGPRKAIIDQLRSIGVATVASSGNSGYTNLIGAPACISTAVSVGSTTKLDAISSFSNRANYLSLMAPGSAILSAAPNATAVVLNGTSMASPHVAGAWAVLKQAAPGASVSHVLTALQGTGIAIPDGALTHRRISVNAARTNLLGVAAGIPGAPGAPVITGAGNAITISFTPPNSGGVPTSYTVLARTTPGGPVVASLPLGGSLSTTVGAPNGNFIVSVQAANGAGAGPESASTSFGVPFAPALPGAPILLGWHWAGTELHLAWNAPITGGPATGYLVVASLSPGGAPVAVLPVAGTTLVVQNIPLGTYYVRVVATNASGAGPSTGNVTVNITGTLAPQTPTMLAPSVAGGLVTLRWHPAQSGGFPTTYTVVAALAPGGAPVATLPTSATTLTVPAPSGTYYVRVNAGNGGGTSGLSNEVTVVVP